MQQHVDAPALAHLGQRLLHRLRVGEVALVPVRGAAGRADRLQRVARRARALDAAPARARRAWASAARRPRLIRSASSRLRPSRSATKRSRSGSEAVGLGDEVEQVEGARRGLRQVGRDRRDDAARRAGDDEHRVARRARAPDPARRRARPGRRSSAGPSAWPISTAPGSRRVSSIRMSASAAFLRLAAKSTALTSACSRSRASALVKPVTAPPSTDVAPAAS